MLPESDPIGRFRLAKDGWKLTDNPLRPFDIYNDFFLDDTVSYDTVSTVSVKDTSKKGGEY